MKTTHEIADDLLIRAKEVARHRKSTLRALAEEGLRETLDRYEQKRAVKIRPVVAGKSGPGPDLSWKHLSQVLYESGEE
jgi:hypothetical protein